MSSRGASSSAHYTERAGPETRKFARKKPSALCADEKASYPASSTPLRDYNTADAIKTAALLATDSDSTSQHELAALLRICAKRSAVHHKSTTTRTRTATGSPPIQPKRRRKSAIRIRTKTTATGPPRHLAQNSDQSDP
ncbi:unnamed protein product, partial [Amoebophrya sp. A120]|eukprot:GSA120T00016033001.1